MEKVIGMRLTRYFILVVLAFLLSACGFQLRGVDQPQLSGKVLLLDSKSPFGEIEKNLKRELKIAGATITDDPQKADAQLTLGELEFDSQGASRDETGRANQVILRAKITFQIFDAKKLKESTVEVEKRQLKASRSYYQDYRNPLSELNLQKQARQDIYNELASHLVRQLAWTLGQ